MLMSNRKLPFFVALVLAALTEDLVRGFVSRSQISNPVMIPRLPTWDATRKPHFQTTLFSKRLPKRESSSLSFSEDAGFLVRTGTPWVLFGGIVFGFHEAFHSAALHKWLWVGPGTWNALSVGVPVVLLGACSFHLVVTFCLSNPNLILDVMGGRENEDDGLNQALSSICDRAGVDGGSTRLYVVPSAEPNAFATGTVDNGAAVAVTEGLLKRLTLAEATAVLAHEVGHVQNRDTVASTQIGAMLAALGFLAQCGSWVLEWQNELFLEAVASNNQDNKDGDDDDNDKVNVRAIGMVLYLAGTLTYCCGTLLRLCASRAAEYEADAFAKSIGEGPALASALEKIRDEEVLPARRDGSALGALNGAYAHAYINNPATRDSPLINLCGLLRTHPSIDDRIQRLLLEE